METIFTCTGPQLRDAMTPMKDAIAAKLGPLAANIYEEKFNQNRGNISNIERTLCENTNTYRKAKTQGAPQEELQQILVRALQNIRVALDLDPERREAVLTVKQTVDSAGAEDAMPVLNCTFPAMPAPAQG